METDPVQETCPTCGTEFQGNYCHYCGEKKLTKRDFSLTALAGELFSESALLDNKLFRTLWLFLRNPGSYLQRYLEGNRKPYLKPIQLFLIANAIYFLVPNGFNTFQTPLYNQRYQMPYSALVQQQIETHIEGSELGEKAFTEEFNQLTSTLSKSIIFLFVLLMSIGAYLLYLRKKIFFLSLFNAMLQLTSFILLILLLGLPTLVFQITLIVPVPPVLYSDLVFSIAMLILSCWYTYLLFQVISDQKRWITALKAVSLNLMMVAVLSIYRFILLQLTLWWM